MIKQVPVLIGLVIALTMTSTAFAQEPIPPQHSAPYWQVSYWNNPTLSGPPVVQRFETHLDQFIITTQGGRRTSSNWTVTCRVFNPTMKTAWPLPRATRT